jgi:hypothetical protein
MTAAPRHNPRYVTLLAVAAALVLIGGWLLRPRNIPASPVPVPSESDLEQLARRAQRRSLDDMTKYFAHIAGEVGPSLAYVPDEHVTGLVWDATRIVTGRLSDPYARPTLTLRFGAASGTGRTQVAAPNLPLTSVAVEAPSAASTAVRRAVAVPEPGDWVVAVWKTAQGPAFAAGTFRQVSTTTCHMLAVEQLQSGLSLSTTMIGGGLFTVNGELLGVILPCGDRVAVVVVSSIDQMLTRSDGLEQRLLSKYGALFSPISEDEQRYFAGGNGLMVRELWNGSPAEAAGLWPGDVIEALGGNAVLRIEDLRPLVEADDPVELRVRRGRTAVAMTLRRNAAASVASEPELVLEEPPDSYRIEAVPPDSRAAHAGIRPGDRLARINGAQPRTLQQVRRALSSSAASPLLLEVLRDQRRIAFVLP